MTNWWDKQIHRAEDLAVCANGSKELLTFYTHLLRAQKDIYDHLRNRKDWLPSGELESDFPVLTDLLPSFLKVVETYGPDPLATEAKDLSQMDVEVVADKLINYCQNGLDVQFFEKSFLQPYLKWLAETGGGFTRESYRAEGCCPFCGGNPQVSYLQNNETSAESGNRVLICATCLSSWEFRRVVCASCGEERPAQLGYFHSPKFDHVRLETCETCRHYIKGIDLTKAGFAEPLVDEIDAAPLDLWAREHGFTKIELNLVGI